MSFIQIRTGPNKGKIFEIREAVITVGRDENQTIQILDQGVSRAHAEIFRMGEVCFVRDLNSTNGTFVNNVKATEEVLKPGDELLIGTTILAFNDKKPVDDVTSLDASGAAAEAKKGMPLEAPGGTRRVAPAGRSITSRNLAVITEASRLFDAAKDLDVALRAVVQKAAEAIEADHAYLYLLDSGTGRPAVRVGIEPGQGGAEKKASRAIISRVMSTGQAVITGDASLDGRFSLSESVVLKKLKSVVAAPVQSRGRTAGLLYFHTSKAEKPFRAEDLELATTIAFQVSLALAPQDSTDRNKELVRRYYQDLWNPGNAAVAAELLAAEVTFWGPFGSPIKGLEGFQQYMSAARVAFPDFQHTIDDLISDGDKVTAKLTCRGTHKGKLLGVAPTGKPVKYPAIAIFRIADAKIADVWMVADTLGLIKQLDPEFGVGVTSQ